MKNNLKAIILTLILCLTLGLVGCSGVDIEPEEAVSTEESEEVLIVTSGGEELEDSEKYVYLQETPLLVTFDMDTVEPDDNTKIFNFTISYLKLAPVFSVIFDETIEYVKNKDSFEETGEEPVSLMSLIKQRAETMPVEKREVSFELECEKSDVWWKIRDFSRIQDEELE